MYELSDQALKEQKKGSVYTLWKLDLSFPAENSYTYGVDEITQLKTKSDEDTQTGEVIIMDADNYLNGLSLEGYEAVISLGVRTIDGDFYVPRPKLWVISQNQVSNRNGETLCHLGLGGIMFLLSKDQATVTYTYDDIGDLPVKELIKKVLNANITPYAHCTSFDWVFDTTDDLMDTFVPKNSFFIGAGETRLRTLKRLLEFTGCVMRVQNDNMVHFFVPVTEASTYDYEYELAHDQRGKHTFFEKTATKSLVFPNKVTVKTPDTADFPYQASATYDQRITSEKTYKADVTSESEAQDMADALLDRHKRDAEKGSGIVPINIGQEVYDYINLIDVRADDTRAGNVRQLTYQLQGGAIAMQFGLGKIVDLPLSLLPSEGGWSGYDYSEIIEQIIDRLKLIEERVEELYYYSDVLYSLIEGIIHWLYEYGLTTIVERLWVLIELGIPYQDEHRDV